MTVMTATSGSEFSSALAAFKRVVSAPKVQVMERVLALPLTVSVATALGAIK